MATVRKLHGRVRGGFVHPSLTAAVDHDQPAGKVDLEVAVEARCREREATVVPRHVGIDSRAESESIAARAGGADVPRSGTGPSQRGKVLLPQRAICSEAACRQHRGAGLHALGSDRDAADGPVLDDQPADPLARRDVPPSLLDRGREDLDDAGAPRRGHVRSRDALLGGVHDLVEEAHAEGDQPLDGGPAVHREVPGDTGLDRTLVEVGVLATQGLSSVVDAGGALDAGARSHEDPTGELGRPAQVAFGLDDQDAGTTVGCFERGTQSGRAGAHDDDVIVGLAGLGHWCSVRQALIESLV